jgi:hypothetical protein
MKTKINSIRILLAFALMLTGLTSVAQEKSLVKTYQIETKDGNSYVGQVLSNDSVKVVFKSDILGEITIHQSDIKKMTALDVKQVKEGQYWLENPQSTRYFFSPNGYGLKKGEGYYQNIWVLMNSFAVGVNDYISLGGGIIPLFLFAGSPTPVYLTAKASIPVVKDKFNLGAGLLAGTVMGESDTGFGIFYGLATVGSKDHNLTMGMGYAFASGEGTSAPMFNLNGMIRVSPKGYLLTENYLFTDGTSSVLLLSLGGRTIIKGAGLDYGLIIPAGSEMDSFVAIPWLGITVPFGKK